MHFLTVSACLRSYTWLMYSSSNLFMEFVQLTIDGADLKVGENQKNDAEISIAILNIPFHYLKLLQLCCLNFHAFLLHRTKCNFKNHSIKAITTYKCNSLLLVVVLEEDLRIEWHLGAKIKTEQCGLFQNTSLSQLSFKCRIVIWNI